MSAPPPVRGDPGGHRRLTSPASLPHIDRQSRVPERFWFSLWDARGYKKASDNLSENRGSFIIRQIQSGEHIQKCAPFQRFIFIARIGISVRIIIV